MLILYINDRNVRCVLFMKTSYTYIHRFPKVHMVVGKSVNIIAILRYREKFQCSSARYKIYMVCFIEISDNKEASRLYAELLCR